MSYSFPACACRDIPNFLLMFELSMSLIISLFQMPNFHCGFLKCLNHFRNSPKAITRALLFHEIFHIRQVIASVKSKALRHVTHAYISQQMLKSQRSDLIIPASQLLTTKSAKVLACYDSPWCIIHMCPNLRGTLSLHSAISQATDWFCFFLGRHLSCYQDHFYLDKRSMG